MGIDISIYGEYKYDNTWNIIPFNMNSYPSEKYELFGARNEYLFAVLGYGSNPDKLKQIKKLKGIPPDCSVQFAHASRIWNRVSYLSLEEILNFNWKESVIIVDYLYTNDTKNIVTTYGELVGPEWWCLIRFLQLFKDDSNIRICFFFDGE